MLNVVIGPIVVEPSHPAPEGSQFDLPLSYELQYLVPKVVNLHLLLLELDHNRSRCRTQRVVLVVGHFLAQQTVTRCDRNLQHIVPKCVLHKLSAEIAVEDLDHASHHLTDLVVEERLAFQVETHELHAVGVLSVCHFERFGVHIPEL